MTQQLNTKAWLQVLDDLASFQEYDKAFEVARMLPAYYRDNVPAEIIKWERHALKQLMNVQEYINNPFDNVRSKERSEWAVQSLVRGRIILEDVKRLNLEGKVPTVVDVGPGEFWLLDGLRNLGCQFRYRCMYLNSALAETVKKDHLDIWDEFNAPLPKDQPVLFFACEIIEHLHWDYELLQSFCKSGGFADILYVSTPLYCYDGGDGQSWKTPAKVGQLGHIRTYTPEDFRNRIKTMFPDFDLQVMTDMRIEDYNENPHGTIVIRGQLKEEYRSQGWRENLTSTAQIPNESL